MNGEKINSKSDIRKNDNSGFSYKVKTEFTEIEDDSILDNIDTLTDKAFFPAPQEGDRRFESCGYLVLERDSKVYFYVGKPVFKKYIVNRPFETMCNNIQSYIDFGME